MADRKCPKCGKDIEAGYGLAYGGMGAYFSCTDYECDWFEKEVEEGTEGLECDGKHVRDEEGKRVTNIDFEIICTCADKSVDGCYKHEPF